MIIFLLAPIVLAQTQSHPLSQLTPIDANLNMSLSGTAYNITSISWITYSGGIVFAGTRGIPTNDIQDSAITSSKIAAAVALTGNVSIDSPTFFVDSSNDRVGIGTTSPDSTLHVIGGVCTETSDTGCAVAAGYVRGNTGLCIGSDCKTSWSQVGGVSPWDNSTTQIFVRSGYPLYINASNTLFVNGTSGRVGIGTVSPAKTLHVVGDIIAGNANAAHGIWWNDTTGTNRKLLYTDGSNQFNIGGISGGIVIKNSTGITGLITDTYYHFDYPDGSLYVDNTNNRVGIGTTGPGYKLDVNGDMNLAAGSVYRIGGVAQSGSSKWTAGTGDDIYRNTGSVGIGTTSPVKKLDVVGDINATGSVYSGGSALGGIPSGAVMFFNLASCPSGWTELTAARGRYLVGLPSGGTLAETAGTALTNLEDRPVGGHTHAISDPGHRHNIQRNQYADAGDWIYTSGIAQVYGITLLPRTDSSTTGITINSTGTAGTNAPYIQLLVCQRD